jgi:DNA-binding LacI/PurR family transcriptional regulator
VPAVLVGRPQPGQAIPYVDADNVGGAALATRFLLESGARRVGTVTGPLDMLAGVDRYAGYRAALATAGVPLRPELVASGDFTEEGGEQAVTELLTRVPDLDAVFVASDLMALGALRALRAAGRAVPGDVAVVGFDDLSVASRAEPPLTTVHQPLGAMTRAMADLLLRQIAGDGSADESVVCPTHLVRRASA